LGRLARTPNTPTAATAAATQVAAPQVAAATAAATQAAAMRAVRQAATPAAPGGTVLSVSTRALLSACERLGVPTDALLFAAGLDPTLVADPEARLPFEKVAIVWREAYRRSGDPYLALHAAEALPFGAYKVFDYVALGSSTVGHGLEQVARYFKLIHDRVRFTIETQATEVALVLQLDDGSSPPSSYVEYTFAAIVLRTRARWGYGWPLVRVELASAPPPSRSEHRRVFGCDVAFRTRGNRLVIARDTWETGVCALEPPLFEVVRDRAEHAMRRLPRAASFAETVEATLRSAIGDELELAQAATRLGTTPRTLQRRLADEGTSFALVRDRARHAAALRLLAQPDVSLGEVSFLLGFSQPSAFNRAFRRWQGTTPLRFRSSVAADAA
jgi:AraC-like DNA-binding protein